jgi:hypothetical protein
MRSKESAVRPSVREGKQGAHWIGPAIVPCPTEFRLRGHASILLYVRRGDPGRSDVMAEPLVARRSNLHCSRRCWTTWTSRSVNP